MSVREALGEELKMSMKAGTTARTSTLRMILARLKDADIAARPRGVEKVSDGDIVGLMRSMIKSRRESVDLYRQGNRPELADKELAEIRVIEGFLPPQLDENAMQRAVIDVLQETRATGLKDMAQVMAALKLKHGPQMDLSAAGPIVRGRLQAMQNA